MGRITGPLIGLKHSVAPPIRFSQCNVRVQKAAFGAISIGDRVVRHKHELVPGGGGTTENIGTATGRNRNSRIIQLELKIGVTVAQIEIRGKPHRLQRQGRWRGRGAGRGAREGARDVVARGRETGGTLRTQPLKKIVRRAVFLKNYNNILDLRRKRRGRLREQRPRKQ